MPQSIGPWQLQSEQKLSDDAVQMLQCVGYLNRIYKNEDTNRQINVTVMVGPGSTMAIHTPEICYESRNFSLLGAKRSVDISEKNNRQHKLWAVDFQTNDTSIRTLRVHYGWSNGGAWTAPDRPRLAFAGERVLYKIQVAEFVNSIDSATERTTSEFLNEFMPMLQQHLVPKKR
jgi:hypothetical protein